MINLKSKYAQDGVNVEVGDDFSSIAGKVCRDTYFNSKFVQVWDVSNGHFRGKRAYSFVNLPEGYLIDQSSDGIGTKAGLIGAARSYINGFKDLCAMTCGDMVASGSLPLVMNNILDVSTLGEKDSPSFNAAKDLLDGMAIDAKDEQLVIFKGETAELGSFVGSEDPNSLLKFNWGATVTGVTHPDKIITGDTLAPGQVVIALRENGFRSNGISSVRKALSIEYGKYGFSWYNNPSACSDIARAATPSVSYNRFISYLNGWFSPDFSAPVKLHAVAHITGGGIKSKFIDDLLKPRGLGSYLDALYQPPAIMQKCIEWRGMDIEESYNTWNMGQGMLLVIDVKDIGTVISLAKEYNIDANHVGDITEGPDSVIICPYFKKKVRF